MNTNVHPSRFSSAGCTALAAAALFLAAVPILAHGDGPYDGTWAPDPAASTHVKTLKAALEPNVQNAPPAPPAAPAAIVEHLPVLNIHQGPDSDFTIAYLDDDGSVISTTEVTTDGVENVNTRAGGALIHRSTSGYDDNGALRTTWRIEQPGGAVVISGTDRLEHVDGSTLRLTTETEDAKSTSRSVIIYRRAPP